MGTQNSNPNPNPNPNHPAEFLCPISGRLMADPVIILSGHSYERSCLQACLSLRLPPPLSPSLSSADVIIPNLSLQAAIFNYCKVNALPRPLPVDFSSALLFVNDLPSVNPTADPAVDCPELVARLTSPDPAAQEAALTSLRASTRDDGAGDRAALCDDAVLTALQPLVRSKHPAVRVNAVAAVVNLSLHGPNRVKIVRAGLVPPLVDALARGGAEAQDHAAAAMFSLSVEEQNRAAIGVLGALPPLLGLVARAEAAVRTRRDAAMALVHLSAAGTNATKLLRLGAVRTLLALVSEPGLGSLAGAVLRNLAAVRDGREAMVEAGAVAALTGVLRVARDEDLKENCLGALYAVSKSKARFRGMAAAAGLELVLTWMDERYEDDGGGDAKRERARALVKRLLRACRGRDEEGSESGSGSWDSVDHGGGVDFVGNFSAPVIGPRTSLVRAHGTHTTRF